MKSRRITLIIAAVGAVATATVAALAVRGGLRYYALNKVLRLPQEQARLAVKPTRRTLTNQAPVHLVNLGYASFDTGSTNQVFVESTSSGASVAVTNRDVYMVFLPPFAADRSANLASSRFSAREGRANPKTVAHVKEWETNQMAAEMAVEETQPLPASRILFMSGDDFLLYSLNVALKVANRFGSKGVDFFQGPYAKGIARFGETASDNRFGAVYLASLDETKNVGLLLRLPNPSSTNLSDYLDPVLRSFRFTAERVGDREAVKALIRGAGIPQGKESTTDE